MSLPTMRVVARRILAGVPSIGIDWRLWARMPMDVIRISLFTSTGTEIHRCERPQFPIGVCVTCGCTGTDPCFYGPNTPDCDGSTCGWVDPSDPRQCTFCGGVDPFGLPLERVVKPRKART
jgi:hypothetical protein